MTRCRVLIDIEFAVDDAIFKQAHLASDDTGVSDVTDAGVRDAVSELLVRGGWAGEGLAPLRSIVTTRSRSAGLYTDVHLAAERGVDGG